MDMMSCFKGERRFLCQKQLYMFAVSIRQLIAGVTAGA